MNPAPRLPDARNADILVHMGGSRQLSGQELLSTRCDPVKLNLLMEKWYWDNGIGQYH